ncbi:MAG: phospholipid carrier-dependent glycosyltransferase [Anaerolineae bacterium]|nr:phospholipid carrier-dependent glycosyltransferase [Anaerolineae bacterium]
MSESASQRIGGSADRQIGGSAGQRIANYELRISRFIFASRILPVLLLLVFFALGCAQIRHASITFDEGPHLAIGYATLRTGDFRLQPVHIHPPLANVLAAAPLLLQDDLPDPRDVDGWEIASLSAITDAIVWQYPHPARLAVAGRTPMLLFGVLLCAIVFRWARDFAGQKNGRGCKAGLLALMLCVFDPNLIAHSTLITTDIAAVFFVVATLYTLRRAVNCGSASQRIRESASQKIGESANGELRTSRFIPAFLFLLTGILLGLAQLAKVSTLLLVPVVGLIVLLDAFHSARIAHYELRVTNHESRITNRYLLFAIRYSLFVFLPAALVLWAGYGFQITPVPGWPFPLPAGTHLLIFQSLYAHYNLGHPTFALGQVSAHGWLWYFPLAFVLKTPLPTMILGVWAVVSSCKLQVASRKLKVKSRKSKVENPESPHVSGFTFRASRFISKIQNPKSKILFLWLFPCLYLASSLFSSVNIGYRHLLPVLPFFYIGIGQMMNHELRIMDHGPASQRVSESASQRIGESANRQIFSPPVYRLPSTAYSFHVSRFMVYALLFWLVLGTLFTFPYPLTFFNELAGGARNGYRYLVDSNLDWGQNMWDLQRWMAEHHESHVFYAHYSPSRPQVYGIAAEFLPPDPRAVSFAPWNPAPGIYAIGATVLQGPYCSDLNTYAWFRTREPDARLGNALFVYRVPARPAPAWVVLCNEAGVGADALTANLGAAAGRLLWLDCAHAQVYPADGVDAGDSTGLYIARADTLPLAGTLDVGLRDAAGEATVAVYRVDALPMPQVVAETGFDGPLDFVGYTRQGAQLWTTWRVREIPAGRPLSLMAHRLAPDGTAAVVGDALGFPVEQWRSGDLIVQRHDLDLPSDVTTTVQLGGYWLDTLERWTTAGGAEALTLEIGNSEGE